MAKKRTVGAGKSKHWLEGRRIKNATRRMKNRLSTLKPETAAIVEDKNQILRRREGKK